MMPKEQPWSGEHSPCATSSKNAKDKSNSLTRLAIRNSKDTLDSGGKSFRCSSEKDSGFSDGSDWQQTDGEDQRSNTSQQSSCSRRAETSQPCQNLDLQRRNPGNPTLMSAGKRDQLLQKNASTEAHSSGAAHIILVQQPSSLLASIELQAPPSQKSSATRKNTNTTYQLIPNSYPRISLPLSKKQPDKPALNYQSHNLSKRVCTEDKSHDTAVTRSLPDLSKPLKISVSPPGLPCSTIDCLSSSAPTTVPSIHVSPSESSLYTDSSFLATRGLHRNGTANSACHRRFQNTVEILRHSGLLGITLRTKELLRQSNSTERDIAQLRQHAELLCQAASNPSCTLNGVTGWEYLHRAMVKSDNYPNLKNLQHLQMPLHPDSASQPVVPSCLLQSHSGQDSEPSTEKVTCMTPDSSTA